MSQPQSNSNEADSFPAKVAEAIILKGLECTVTKQEAALFYRLKVFKLDGPVLEIALIDLQTWKNPAAEHEYSRILEEVSTKRANGKRITFLWQDQWERSPEIALSRINAVLGESVRIPGRLTRIARIDKKTTELFLSLNHLQGNVSSKYRYGLYLPVKYFRVLPADYEIADPTIDLLVAVATFSHVRIFEKDGKPYRSFEMIRFANLIDTTVVGGLNKLLAAFENDFKPDDIMTYADLEWSDGASYRKLGFEAITEKPPISFWVDEYALIRYNNDDTQKELTRITNAGSRKFVKVIKPENWI